MYILSNWCVSFFFDSDQKYCSKNARKFSLLCSLNNLTVRECFTSFFREGNWSLDELNYLMEPLWWYRLEPEWKSTPNSLQSPSSFHSATLVATKHYPGICLLKQDDKKRSCRHIFVGFYLFWIWVLFGFLRILCTETVSRVG